jgi:hypothetical protein
MGENPEDRFCFICQGKFEFFFNDDMEEWHLRAAVRVDWQTYHSLCYEDYKGSLEPSANEETGSEETSSEVTEETKKIMWKQWRHKFYLERE